MSCSFAVLALLVLGSSLSGCGPREDARNSDQAASVELAPPTAASTERSLAPREATESAVADGRSFDGTNLVITLGPGGALTLNGEPMKDLGELTAYAKRSSGEPKAAHILADKSVPYADVVRLIDALKQASVTRVSLGVAPDP